MNIVQTDLGNNIITTIYLTFSHNYLAIAYFFGLLISLGMAIYKPSRISMLFLIGFGFLLFGFEYDKHIIVAFREQTLKSLITVTSHYKIQKIISLVISDLLPVFFYSFGWLTIYIGIIYQGIKKNK